MQYMAVKRAGAASSAIAFALSIVLCLSMAGSAKCEYQALNGADPSQIKAGDLVCFGRYPQSLLGTDMPLAGTENIDWVKANDVRNSDALTYYAIEPIVWRVLENSGDELFLVSEKIIDCMPYNDTLPSVAWKDCTIRKWLNDAAESGSFINRAFGESENAVICASPEIGGGDMADPIFCLSFNEIDKYFADDADRVCYNTDYSAAIHSLHADYWWLRTPPGGADGYAAYVSDFGKAYTGGHHPFYIVGVRPALRVDLSSAGEVLQKPATP